MNLRPLKLLDRADDEAIEWIKSNLMSLRRDDGTMQYTLTAVVRAFQAGKEAGSTDLQAATGYAERLAIALMEKHFPEATTWKPLSGDLIGILTQIDNLTTGLRRSQPRETST